MKIKTTVVSRPKTQANSPASRNSSTKDRRGKPGSGKKKPKKEDNTKIYIGVGVGVFFLLIIIIAVASRDNKQPVTQNVATVHEDKFSLKVDVRKEIYKEYVVVDNKIEDESETKISNSSDPRKEGQAIRNEADGKRSALKISLLEKWKKKYPELSISYINKIVAEGSKNNWR